MQRLSADAGRDRPLVAAISYMSPGRTVEEAARSFNIPELCAAMRQFVPPPSGAFNSYDDFDGAAIAGPADVIVEHVNAFHALGVEHFVFDFRTRFSEFEECVEMVGTEVLPQLRRGG